VAFCFSMTVGVIWEFFECTMDQLFFLDMQKLNAEAERWHSFQADVERQFLRPEKSDLKWQ